MANLPPNSAQRVDDIITKGKEGESEGGRVLSSLMQRSLLLSMKVGFSDSGPTLYLVRGRAKPVLYEINSTESNLFHH